ncbi:MAG: carbohydrate ABC transporter permease, partial [Candidatus Dormibacteraceae bacterium]
MVKIAGPTARWIVLCVFIVLCAFPFAWATFTIFKTNPDLYTSGHVPFLYTQKPTFENVTVLFGQTDYLVFVRNTVIVGVIVVVLTLLGSVPAAYAIARLTGSWGSKVGIAIFIVYLVPPTLLFLPMARVVAVLGLTDSIWSLVVVYPTLTMPLSTWLLIGFFRGVPRDIEEQATVDGYSRFGAFWRTVLPLAMPGMLTVAVFSFA